MKASSRASAEAALAARGWRWARAVAVTITGITSTAALLGCAATAGTPTSQPLAGDWVLTHWGAGGREPVSLAPTLSVQDGRVSGWAGCNRYMGALLGEGAREEARDGVEAGAGAAGAAGVAGAGTPARSAAGAAGTPFMPWRLGPLATTRMACDEAAMAVERRFLEQLGRSTRLWIEGGRLRLEHPDDSGAVQVLRFDRR